MLTTRPCTATCVLDGMPVTLTFYPDNGVLRIADPSGSCVREMRWHASWRALLDEFRSYNERSELHGRGVAGMMDRIDGQASQSLQNMALA
jgi:hypothetical protein